jgi:hypothetical protein
MLARASTHRGNVSGSDDLLAGSLLIHLFVHGQRPLVDSLLSDPFSNVLSFCHHRVKNASTPSNPSLAKNIAWTISSLCRGEPAPNLDTVKASIVPLLAHNYKKCVILVKNLNLSNAIKLCLPDRTYFWCRECHAWRDEQFGEI